MNTISLLQQEQKRLLELPDSLFDKLVIDYNIDSEHSKPIRAFLLANKTILDSTDMMIQTDLLKFNVDEECASKGIYNIKQEIGRGTYGGIFDAVNKLTNENVIIKFQKIASIQEHERILREIDIQKRMSDFGFAPKIYASWDCDDVSVVVMEKFDGNIETALVEHYKLSKKIPDKDRHYFFSNLPLGPSHPSLNTLSTTDKKTFLTLNPILTSFNNQLDFLFNPILLLNVSNLAHFDIKPSNIYYKKISDNVYRFVFGDFGLSHSISWFKTQDKFLNKLITYHYDPLMAGSFPEIKKLFPIKEVEQHPEYLDFIGLMSLFYKFDRNKRDIPSIFKLLKYCYLKYKSGNLTDTTDPKDITNYLLSTPINEIIRDNKNISNWQWDLISRNPTLTFNIVLSNPDKPWNMKYVSSHNNISWNDIHKNLHINWDWTEISKNPNITLDIIKNNPTMPWDYWGVSQNPNLTLDFIKQNIDKQWSWNYVLNNPSIDKSTIQSLLTDIKKKPITDIVKEMQDILPSKQDIDELRQFQTSISSIYKWKDAINKEYKKLIDEADDTHFKNMLVLLRQAHSESLLLDDVSIASNIYTAFKTVNSPQDFMKRFEKEIQWAMNIANKKTTLSNLYDPNFDKFYHETITRKPISPPKQIPTKKVMTQPKDKTPKVMTQPKQPKDKTPKVMTQPKDKTPKVMTQPKDRIPKIMTQRTEIKSYEGDMWKNAIKEEYKKLILEKDDTHFKNMLVLLRQAHSESLLLYNIPIALDIFKAFKTVNSPQEFMKRFKKEIQWATKIVVRHTYTETMKTMPEYSDLYSPSEIYQKDDAELLHSYNGAFLPENLGKLKDIKEEDILEVYIRALHILQSGNVVFINNKLVKGLTDIELPEYTQDEYEKNRDKINILKELKNKDPVNLHDYGYVTERELLDLIKETITEEGELRKVYYTLKPYVHTGYNKDVKSENRDDLYFNLKRVTEILYPTNIEKRSNLYERYYKKEYPEEYDPIFNF